MEHFLLNENERKEIEELLNQSFEEEISDFHFKGGNIAAFLYREVHYYVTFYYEGNNIKPHILGCFQLNESQLNPLAALAKLNIEKQITINELLKNQN